MIIKSSGAFRKFSKMKSVTNGVISGVPDAFGTFGTTRATMT